MVREAIGTARAAGATGEIRLRGDSAYGTSAVVSVCVKAGARFSVALVKHCPVNRAIASIDEHAWTPVHYPGSVIDRDTSELISDAEVAEVPFVAFAATKHPVTARLVVRRVRDRAKGDELFPVWPYHPFLTNSTEPPAQADITHNLLRAAGTLTSSTHAVASGATLRRQLITVPARLAGPNAASCCTYQSTGPGPNAGAHSGAPCSHPPLARSSLDFGPRRTAATTALRRLFVDAARRRAMLNQQIDSEMVVWRAGGSGVTTPLVTTVS